MPFEIYIYGGAGGDMQIVEFCKSSSQLITLVICLGYSGVWSMHEILIAGLPVQVGGYHRENIFCGHAKMIASLRLGLSIDNDNDNDNDQVIVGCKSDSTRSHRGYLAHVV